MTDNDKLVNRMLERLNQLENLPRNVRDHELAKFEKDCQRLGLDEFQPFLLELIESHRAESRQVRGDEQHTTDLPEDAPAPDADLLPPDSDAGIDALYQPALDRLHDFKQRGVITQVQSLVLQAASAEELARLVGRPVPDTSRRKYGVDIDRARNKYSDLRELYNRRFAKLPGFKRMPRLKKAAFVRELEKARAAIEADRENPKPMPPESERRGMWVMNKKGEIAPHIGPDP